MARIAFVLLSVLLAVDSSWPGSALAEPMIRVYNPEGRAANLSKEAIREIFFMRQRAWSDGTPIQVFVLPDDDPVHQRFAKEVLGVYPFQLRTAWDRLIYSGTGQAPIQVNSVQEMIDQLQETPGSIGYVLQEQDPYAH